MLSGFVRKAGVISFDSVMSLGEYFVLLLFILIFSLIILFLCSKHVMLTSVTVLLVLQCF